MPFTKHAQINEHYDERAAYFENDVLFFDDIRAITLNQNPWKVECPVFVLVLEGEASVKVNLDEYHLERHSLCTLMPNHILHGYQSPDDFRGIFIVMSNKFAAEVLPDITTALPIIMDFRNSPIITLNEQEGKNVREFYEFVGKKGRTVKGEFSKQEMESLLRAFFFEVLTIYRERFGYDQRKRTRNEETFYNFYHLVEENFQKNRSVQFYADELDISPKHLTSVVKKVTNRTASDWIDDYVILYAKQMLRSSSQPIQSISKELNFPNQSFFGKFFKKHTGKSPSEYREAEG
mgnify:FL=1